MIRFCFECKQLTSHTLADGCWWCLCCNRFEDPRTDEEILADFKLARSEAFQRYAEDVLDRGE